MASWRRFWRLSSGERRVFLQALLLVPLVDLAMKLFGFRRVQAALARLAPVKMEAEALKTAETMQWAAAAARMVAAAARRSPVGGKCLDRSLVLWWMLLLRGVASELRIGARRHEGQFEAHAWVEWNGTVLNDSEDVHERFAVLGPSAAPGDVAVR